jgi:hypothetical protein
MFEPAQRVPSLPFSIARVRARKLIPLGDLGLTPQALRFSPASQVPAQGCEFVTLNYLFKLSGCDL